MSATDTRQLVLVAGVGRSGTSLLTGILGGLGFHVPQPEVKADDTNPRGFSEPRWVVDFHQRLMRGRRVTVNDSRPAAFADTWSAGESDAAHDELKAWLAGELAGADRVVVKDPRTSWFLPLWARCAAELGVPTSFVTMLRHPAEIIASAQKSYGTVQPGASRAAAWINVTLETERATRGTRRAFVRYDDLLADWDAEVRRVGTLLEVPSLAGVRRADFPQVDGFVDPTLHRNRAGWEEHEVPARVRDMAEDLWERVQPLAAPGGDTGALRARLDEARTAYDALYAEAEAIAWSSAAAAGKARKAKAKANAKAAAPAAPAPAQQPSLRVRVARRVPVRYRRQVRRALRSLQSRGSR
jgi:hypothetical protein